MDHFQAPRNRGCMPYADAIGEASLDGTLPRMTFYLRLENDLITRASFETSGCGVAIAACSLLTVIATNRSVCRCLELSPLDLDAALGGLPAEKKYCANLAIEALKNAILSRVSPEDASAQHFCN